MANNKISKAQLRELKAIAKLLPKTYYSFNSTFALTGKQIIEKKVPTSLEINPDKIYIKTGSEFKNQRRVNHLNRLKTAFRNGGEQLVLKYVQQVQSINEGSAEKQAFLDNLVKGVGL